MDGGGGRPGVDLIGGGRRGRSFTLEGRGGRGGSDTASGLVWITGPFLAAGAGAAAGVGGLRPGVGEAVGLGVVAAGLGGAGFESGAETPAGLGARFGALALRGEVSAAGLVGMPGRLLPVFTVWFEASCASLVPASVCAPPLTSTEGLGGRVGVVCPDEVLLSWDGAPTLALGATRGLGGGLGLARGGVSLTDGVSLGGGGLGAGTGAGISVADCGFGVIEGFSVFLQGTRAAAGFGGQDVVGSVAG